MKYDKLPKDVKEHYVKLKEKTRKFRKDYLELHNECPICGATKYTTHHSSKSSVLDLSDIDGYTDNSVSICNRCGLRHTIHERVAKKWVKPSKTFNLVLKKKWFDMILSGEKKEEYRDLTKYWEKRFAPMLLDFELSGYNNITFSHGYAKDRRQIVVEWSGIFIREGKLEWGATEDTKYFVLELGEILSTKNVTL